MSGKSPRRLFDRRSFLKGAGAALVASAGAGLMPGFLRRGLFPAGYGTAAAADQVPDLVFGGTDGWISLPSSPALEPFYPDNLAPPPFNTYIFGFRNLTGLDPAIRDAQKNKAQHSAPLFWVNQYDPGAAKKDFKIQLFNLGLQLRPDLFDAHTVHWHGFRNVIPIFDGEPTGSVAVRAGTNFTYVYRPRDPGTYMFHCHVEDVEHVQMGMTGPVFVRPLQNGNTNLYPSGKYAYNDGNGSTGYDREYAMFLSEVFAWAHWADAHIQLPEWSDYRADFALLNGRIYPDTLAPNGSIDPFNPVRDAGGDLIAPANNPHLQYQPLSALVKCQPGERVLLRFANLGFKEAAMTLAGIKMKVVGKDATPMLGRDGTDTSYEVNTVSFGAGESIDAIFTAPPFRNSQPLLGYDTYVLYNRNYQRSNNLAAGGFGGQRTEVRVYPAGSLTPQTIPNQYDV
jgi:FtsP/CotA-like multicopper oxidase with cupredoxin domain